MFGHMIFLIKLQVKLEFGPFVCLCCLALQLCPKVFISQEKGISHSEYFFQLIANDRRKIYDDTIWKKNWRFSSVVGFFIHLFFGYFIFYNPLLNLSILDFEIFFEG